ncbi:MAG: copper-binding protein [Candidatus Tectomicrobia bacterium]|nr:copper-binding protein [Candidatus Tectomicrobia bacterium]
MPFQSLLHVLSPSLLAPRTGSVRDVYTWTLERQSMLIWNTLCVVSLFVFTGCAAAYTPPLLTTAHPAHPEAMAAPEPPSSTTLAYMASDVPSPQPTYSMAQRDKEDMRPSAQESQQTVVGEGQVIAVVPSSNQVVVDHKEIKGFMDAMTMGYRVDPPSVLEGLNAGDKVRFTIDTQQKAIVKIEKMKE